MSNKLKENKIEEHTKNKIYEYLSSEQVLNAGIVFISMSNYDIKLGAMNPIYQKVIDIKLELETEFSLNVEINQISTEEWEKWNSDIISSKEDFSNSLTKNADQKSINNEDYNKPINESLNSDKNKDTNKINTKIEKEKNSLNSSLLQEMLNDEFSDGLISNKDDKFDLFDEDNDLEEEDELDIIEDTELKDNEDPVIKAAGSILSTCSRLKASDIHAEPLEDRMRIRYRIDGVLKEVYSLPKAKAKAITSRLKVMSKLDIAEKRLPQDGRIRCRINEVISDFRVSTLPGKWGEKIVLRALQSDSSMLDLDKLITSKDELSKVREMGSFPYGIFIVVGPTGSGKSTTLYSILNERNTPDVNISTVEDPVEYTLDGIHQVQVIREKGLDFALALRSLMRQDPDIILVGETRDKETAQTAMEAALTGHMVFTTLHANDTATAITRLNEMGIPPYLVGSSVVGVMAQRLIRKICHKCCTTRNVDPQKDKLAHEHGIQVLKKANVLDLSNNASKDLCPICNGTGYKGRLGLFEVMKVNDSIRELIMKSSTADIIRNCALNNGVKSLLDYGLDLVKDGLTTIEEVERVCLLND
ncbi:type II/IV secretion system protein [Prochlorococcus marinus str. MU1404]|uniref:GspE/PulE family protein n=1 Tax=Prochlorococcus marinus TaxID=1219 RepID=UPI001ADACEE9|nr:GspE/PulE family protein [Prochlorococcus marinus]MBO8229881.1 type II/IV secretion system protein [Prochlorococcus marinus XMU1404]MBW3073334.1 type II/IV secretion system protein [Prochlorococcus marinus str. MU1404]MCR8545783.1 GspE/PulE family protein [Prochlorococcus marinus CUG1432]